MDIVFKNQKDVEDYFGKSKYIEICIEPNIFSEDCIFQFYSDYIQGSIDCGRGYDAFVYMKNEVNANDYASDMLDEDELKDEYIALIESDMKPDDELNVEDSDFDFIASQMSDDAFDSEIFKNNFDNAVESVMIEFEQNREFNDAEDGFENESIDDEEDSYVNNPSELLEHDDKVGDVVYIENDAHIDYDNRDYAFIYIDGEIYYNDEDSSLSHSELLVEYLQEHGEDDNIPEDMLNGKKEDSRPTKQRLQRLTGGEYVAFGHVMDNVAYVETLVGSVDAETVSKACKKQLDVAKVYQLDTAQQLVRRLAKSIKYRRMI